MMTFFLFYFCFTREVYTGQLGTEKGHWRDVFS